MQMVVSDVMEYKLKIMNKIISTPDIFELVNNKDISKPSQMRNKNIFSFMKIPNTTMSVKNYLCFDYNSKISNRNKVYKDITINIAVVCHESDITTSYGNRHDVLGGVVIDTINWSDFLGFQLELVSDKEDVWEKEYNVRILQFKNLTLNSFENGVKINGIR